MAIFCLKRIVTQLKRLFCSRLLSQDKRGKGVDIVGEVAID